jgi:hypothetical protein
MKTSKKTKNTKRKRAEKTYPPTLSATVENRCGFISIEPCFDSFKVILSEDEFDYDNWDDSTDDEPKILKTTKVVNYLSEHQLKRLALAIKWALTQKVSR